MLSLSKKTDYGLLLLTLLAKTSSSRFTSIKSIAKGYDLPYKYLSQIALNLKDAGLLKSKEGTTGGYQLKLSPKKLMVSQIIEALEGELTISCGSSRSCACGQACLHEGVMEKVLGGMQDYSLADLMERQ